MINQKQYYFDKFGPIFHYFIQKLDEYMAYFDDGDTVFLFCSRAGVTIERLYKEYIGKKHLHTAQSAHIFWTSRFILSKSFLLSENRHAQQIMLSEHRHTAAEVFLSTLTSKPTNIVLDKKTTAADTIHLLKNKDTNLTEIISDLEEQSIYYKNYIANLIGDKKRVVLIDSGWQGSIQDLLQEEYPHLDVHGIYFGKIGTPSTDRKYHGKKYGLVFEAETNGSFRDLKLSQPQQVFALHRHIIEDVLEPNFSSVESIRRQSDGSYLPQNYEDILREQYAPLKDSTRGIFDYLLENAASLARGKVQELFFQGCGTLRKSICHPEEHDLQALGTLHRSFDFGKKGGLAVLFPREDRHLQDSPHLRIKESLWSHGQIAIEYGQTNFAFNMQQALQESKSLSITPLSKVAIITRTKNRPILLERAARSVLQQTYINYVWVVVNDGGEEYPVLEVIRKSGIDPSKIILVSNPVSLGMEAASNKGISNSTSDYIVIHDDDDSWHEDFLLSTVKFLDNKVNKHYEGVITGTTYISEEILPEGQVKIHNSRLYNEWVKTVHLSEMANGNFFAPIAFLFSRKIYDLIGGYDETLPVLGDWDFNLRFLTKSNIGVIPASLANYHHRDVNTNVDSTYSNSVIGGISKHMEFEPIVRNKFLRSNDPEYQCLSHLLAVGYASNSHKHITHQILNDVSTQKSFSNSETTNEIITSLLKAPKFACCFDTDYYEEKNPDLKAAVTQGVLDNLLTHFIEYGHRENRPYRINISELKKQLDSSQNDERELKQQLSLCRSLSQHIKDIVKLHHSIFDVEYYLINNPDVAEHINKGQLNNATEHFISHGLHENRSFRLHTGYVQWILSKEAEKNWYIRHLAEKKKGLFDETFYLEANPDIKAAVITKQFKNGLHHFVTCGFNEQRPYRLKIENPSR